MCAPAEKEEGLSSQTCEREGKCGRLSQTIFSSYCKVTKTNSILTSVQGGVG
jgi:hypothetical protein